MTDIAGKHVAVTGAAGGIGQAMCHWLEERDATAYALDVRAAEHQPGVFIHCDVTDPVSVATARKKVLAQAGAIDGLVVGAGVAEDDVSAETMEISQFDDVLAVNLRGAFLSCQEFARPMLERGTGSIVAISSMSGNRIVNEPQRQAAYNASKAGLSALVKSLAVEWGPRGVRVNAVSPGYVATPMLDRKRDMHEEWRQRTVLGRFAEPVEIAAAVGFLLGDAAGFCCGTELLVDGGYSLR